MKLGKLFKVTQIEKANLGLNLDNLAPESMLATTMSYLLLHHYKKTDAKFIIKH